MMKYIQLLISAAIMLPPTMANAYIGPGAALSLLGSALGVGTALFLGIIFTLAWPLWLLYKKFKKKKVPQTVSAQDQGDDGPSAN